MPSTYPPPRRGDVKRRVPVGAFHRAGDRCDQSDRRIGKKGAAPALGARSAAAAIIRWLDTLLKRRLVGGAYPSGSRSRSDVSPAHTARDRSVLLSPPDGFRLGKHTDVASSLAGRAYRLPRDIHHRIIARPCSRAVRTCGLSSVSALHKAAKACMCKRTACKTTSARLSVRRLDDSSTCTH